MSKINEHSECLINFISKSILKTCEMSSFLITGSSGFLGKHLVSSIEKNHKVLGLSNDAQYNKSKNFSHLQLNLKKKKIEIKQSISTIVHLAAMSDITLCNKNPSLCYDINISGTKKMLDICRKKDANFIFASSSYVYGHPKKLPISEKEPLKPNSIYGASKILAESLCEGYAKIYGLNITVLRFFSIYGPNSPNHNIIFNIIKQQLKSPNITIGNRKPKRDFVYVDDVINAIKLVSKNQKGFDILNVGSGKSFSIEYICKKIAKISKKKQKIVTDNKKVRKNDIPEMRCSYGRIKKIHNWKPKISIDYGLAKTYDYYLNMKKSKK